MTNVNNAAATGGRLLMSVIFLLSGLEKLIGFGGTVAYMASQGLPLPMLAAIVAVVVECVGGLLVLIGYQTRTTTLVLAAWSVATALLAHAHFSDPNQMINFLKKPRDGWWVPAALRLWWQGLERRRLSRPPVSAGHLSGGYR
jgi:putative oxidoreductase